VEPVAEYRPFAFSGSSQGKSGRKKCQPVKIAFISSLDSPKETRGEGGGGLKQSKQVLYSLG